MEDKEGEHYEFDILIIDDSKFVIDSLTKFIELKGFTCRAVDTIPKAMEILNLHKPQLIFLDVNLPDSNGYEFCSRLKSNEKFNKILIYFFTGVSESEVAIKALETKADGYLTKPFNMLDFNEIFDHLDKNNDN